LGQFSYLTFDGKIPKGLDFLDFHFRREGLSVSKMTVINLKWGQFFKQLG